MTYFPPPRLHCNCLHESVQATPRLDRATRPLLNHFWWLGCLLLLAGASPSNGQNRFRTGEDSTGTARKPGALTLRDNFSFAADIVDTPRTSIGSSFHAIALQHQLAVTRLPQYDSYAVRETPAVRSISFESPEMSLGFSASMLSSHGAFVGDVTPVAEPATWVVGAFTAGALAVPGLKRKKSRNTLLWLARIRILFSRVFTQEHPIAYGTATQSGAAPLKAE